MKILTVTRTYYEVIEVEVDDDATAEDAYEAASTMGRPFQDDLMYFDHATVHDEDGNQLDEEN